MIDRLLLLLLDWLLVHFSKQRRYIVIGLQPFSFWWVEEPPYTHIEKMCYENGAWCVELEGRGSHLLWVVDLQWYTVTSLREYDNGMTALTFLERRGTDGQPHPNGGAYWVTMDWGVLK